MRKITIADISLRESEQDSMPKLSFKEKLETAKLLEKLQVDVIETGPPGDTPAGLAFIRTLASTLEGCTLSVPVELDKAVADRACDALMRAKKPRLNVIFPTSTVQMEYERHIKAEAALPLLSEMVAYCSGLCPDIEFTAVDSTRSDIGFLASVLKAVLAAGAKTVTLCDSTGELLPDELSLFISKVYDAVPELREATLSLHCKDYLGLGGATALAGIKAGADVVKVSSCLSSGTLSLERFANVIKMRGETLGISDGINNTALTRTCSQLAALTGMGGAPRVASREAGDSDEIPDLPENISADALSDYITALGYDVTNDDLERIFVRYEEISGSKKVVERDVEAIIAETAGQAPQVYKMRNYVINSGNAITATAHMTLTKDGVVVDSLSSGDGPIDAAFKASEQAIGVHYELDEFQIRAVTGGREATGDALVKLRHSGKLYSGRGVSTDIIEASIRAYLSAANKIIHEERHG